MKKIYTKSVGRVIFGWCILTFLTGFIISALITGEITLGRHGKNRYYRSETPSSYWWTVVAYSCAAGLTGYGLLRTKIRAPGIESAASPVIREGMDNPLHRK